MVTALKIYRIELQPGVLREATAEAQNSALWLPGACGKGVRFWERVHAVPHSEFVVDAYRRAALASIISARQQTSGFWRKVSDWFELRSPAHQWTLPNGEIAEQVGMRQDDALLLWSEDEANLLSEPKIRERWPGARRVEQIGANLFLVTGVVSVAGPQITKLAKVAGCPFREAEQTVETAAGLGIVQPK